MKRSIEHIGRHYLQEKRQLLRTVLVLYSVPKYWPLKYNIVGRNVDLLPYMHIDQTLEATRDSSLLRVQKETIFLYDLRKKIHDAIRNRSYLGTIISLVVGVALIFLAMLVSKVGRKKLDFLGLSKPPYTKKD